MKARTRAAARGVGLICGLGMALSAISARAGTFVASASVSGNNAPMWTYDFSLPQYSGPGTITSVELSMSGVAGGNDFYTFIASDGLTVPSYPISWDVYVYMSPPASEPTLDVQSAINTEYVGGVIPPCVGDGCPTFGYAYFGPPDTAFSANAMLADLSDFRGTGSNDFFLYDGSSFTDNTVSATVTETITTTTGTVPEPATWALGLLGLSAIGAVVRGRRARRSGHPIVV